MSDWLRQLGVRVPILNAGMAQIAGPRLAAAVSEAGGLGVLGMGASPPEAVRDGIQAYRSRCDRAFGVNLILPLTQGGEVEVCLEERVPLLVLFWGDVAPYTADAARRGVLLFAQVGDAEEAARAVEAGAAGVIVQGIEAGGHVRAERPLHKTLADTRAELASLPVVASGGIADGADIARVLALGADAVSIGTRFVATPEAAVVGEYRERIVKAKASDTVLTKLFDRGWPDAQHRVIRNHAYRDWESAGRPAPGDRPEEGRVIGTIALGAGSQELPRYTVMPPVAGFEGDLEETALYCGVSCDKIAASEPAAVIVDRLASELRAYRR